MAPKRKCPTPSHKSSQADASSGEGSCIIQSFAAAKDGTSKKPARYKQLEKPHDPNVAELSRVLRGGGNGVEFENSDWASEASLLHLTDMGLGEEVVRVGMKMIDSSKIEKLKEAWRQLRLSELQVASDRAELLYYQANLFMDVYSRAKQQG